MILEKVEFHGFKSFADKIELTFNNGVTAIIGPNGCGKSNFADAIRWTLGEQSSKQLRGTSMQDVIFAGTEHRKSLSYCDVSIFFNNEDHKVFPNLSYDQVIITRKLDRSGNSEYLLNNSNVRLKDIISLLHDTGIGKEGYSIIGQGRIDAIVSKKPDERRQVFEEAAGISKFRAQKNEAERNLERTKVNLDSQIELINEIEKTLKPLRKQAEDAMVYFDLKEQLKSEEINAYIYMYENNKSMKDRIKERLSKILEDLDNTEAAYKKVLEESSEAFTENSGMDQAINAYNAELTTLKVDAAHLAGDLKVVQEKIMHLQESKQRCIEDIAEIEEDINNHDADIKAANDKKADLEKEHKELSEEYDAVDKLYKEVSKTAEDSNIQYVKSLEELRSLQSNLVVYKSQKASNETRKQSLENMVDEKAKELASIATDYAINYTSLQKAIERKNELLSNKLDMVDELEDAKASLDEIGQSLNTFSISLQNYKDRLELYESTKSEYTRYNESIKKLMTFAKADISISDKVLGVLGEVMDVPKDYIAAIEYALGGALQTVLVRNTNDANDLIAFLKQKQLGRITFRPLTSCKERMLLGQDRNVLNEIGVIGVAADLVKCKDMYRPFINSFLGATVVVDTGYTAATIQRKYNFNFKIVTLDGDIYEKSGDITGGSRRNETSGILSQEKSIEETRQNIERTQKNIKQYEQLRDAKTKEVKELTESLRSIEEEVGTLAINISVFSEKVESFNTRKNAIAPDLDKNKEELEEINSTLADLDQKIAQIEKIQEDVDKNKEKYNELFSENQDQGEDKKNELGELMEKVLDLGKKAAEKKVEIDNTSNDIFRLKNEKEQLITDKMGVEAELKEVESQLDAINSAEKKNISPKDQARIEELESLIGQIQERREALSKKLRECEVQKETLNNQKAELFDKKAKEESLLTKCEDDLINMQQNILDEYNLTYGNCLEYRVENYEYNGSKTRISDIKRNIAKLGDVNPLAVETLKETEERYNEYVKSRDDIQKAYDDIINIINTLMTEMRTKFMDAFTKINENFQRIFVQLFGGGKGELKLNFDENPEKDVLEAGIDILATPAGKRLQNISLLSGGERALTAIAILFAIISLNPMPFCVLDEIDAALDDTNANLFAEFLQKYSSKTQFIVITHKKPTMVKADSIYGVTQEEPGVTKFVSVSLESAEQFIKEHEKEARG